MPDIAGLKLIVPTSATATGAGSSATVSATGKVTFTSAATLTIEGCFSATYDNYLFVMRHVDSAQSNNDIDARLRVSGSDASGTNYTDQYIYAESTTVGAARETSQTAFRFAVTSTTHSGSHTYIYGPNLAQPTAARLVSMQGTSGARIVDNAMTHSLSTAYTGITLFTTLAGSITGALTIYGLAQ